MGTFLRLYDASKTPLGLLPEHSGLVNQIELNAPGSLTCSYPMSGVNVGLLDRDVAYLAIVEGGVESPDWFVLDEDTDDESDPGGASRMLTIAGRGLMAVLEQAEVYPKAHTPGAAVTNMVAEHAFADSTPGTILKTFIDRAKARGCFPDLTYDFTATTDSNGVAWPKVYDITYPAGTNYLTLATDMAENEWIDLRMVGFKLQAFIPDTVLGGTMLSNVVLRAGQQVLSGPRRRSRRGIISHLLGLGEGKNIVEVSSAPTATRYGRREGNAADGRLTTTGSVTNLANATLSQNTDAKEGITLKLALNPPAGESWPIPGKDFTVGQRIAYDKRRDATGAFEPMRVRTITWEWGSSNDFPACSIEVNDVFVEGRIRTRRRVEGILNGSVVTAPPPVTPPVDRTWPTAPTGLTVTPYLYVASNRDFAGASVSWVAPAVNSDGSPYTDHSHYQVQHSVSGGSWIGDPATQELTTYLESLPVGASLQVRVAATDTSGHSSGWVTSSPVTLPRDTTPPPRPSKLTCTVRLGVVTVTWDGKDSTGTAMPADFTWLRVFRSTDPGVSAPAGTFVDLIYVPNGSVVVSGLPYNVPQTFTAVAVDRAGNESVLASAASTITVLPLVDTDVIGKVIDGAANLIAQSVGSAELAIGGVKLNNLNADAVAAIDKARTDAVAASALTAQDMADLAEAGAIAQATLITNKVNNPTRTGTTDGWLLTGTAGGLVVENKDFNGTTIKTLKVTSDGNTVLESGIFELDPTKAYEYRAWVLDPTDVAGAVTQFYVGAHFYDAAISSLSVQSHYQSSGAANGAPTANFYCATKATNTPTWTEYVWWALPRDASVPNDLANLGVNGTSNTILPANAVRAKFRVLNWSNAGTSRTLWVANLTVREMPLSLVRNSLAVDAWRVPGTVQMDGGKLYADSVIAGKLAGDSVLATNIKARNVNVEHLTIGSMTNLAPGGCGEFGGVAGSFFDGATSVTFSSSSPPAGIGGYFVTSGQGVNADTAKSWDVEPNTEYLVEMWVKASVANSRMYVELRDQDNAHGTTNAATPGETWPRNGSSTAYPMQDWTIPTAWTRYVSIATTTATATKLRIGTVYFNHSNGSVTNATQSFAIRVRPRAAGKLIVDGSIIADKLAANAVTTPKLAAGAATVEKLTVGSIGDELCVNGGMEEVSTLDAALPAAWTKEPIYGGGTYQWATATPIAGSRSIELRNSVSGAGSGSSSIASREFPVSEGQRYALKITAKDTSGTSPGFYYGLVGGATPGATSTVYGGFNLNCPTTTTEFSAVVTIPSLWKFARVHVMNYSLTSTALHTITVDQVSCRPVIVSAQIDDGVITTPKLAALAVQAGNIAANAVETDKLAVGAVTAENIKLGTFNTNPVPDPSFEEDYSIGQLSASPTNRWRWDHSVGAGTVTRWVGGRTGRNGVELSANATTGSARVRSGNFAVTPGYRYVVSVYAGKMEAVTSRLYVRVAGGSTDALTEYPASSTGTMIPWDGGVDDQIENVDVPLLGDRADSDAYGLYSGIVTIPAGITRASIMVWNYQPTAVSRVMVDDVAIIPLGNGASELTAAGLRIFGVDGIETGAFVSNRASYFSIASKGETVATIDSKGGAAFSTLSVAGLPDGTGISFWGEELKDILNRLPRGLKQYANSGGNYGPYTSEAGYFLLDTLLEGGRMYRIGFHAHFLPSQAITPIWRIRATLSTAAGLDAPLPTQTSPTLLLHQAGSTIANNARSDGADGIFRTPYSLEGYNLKLWLTLDTTGTGTHQFLPPGDGGENWLHHINDAGDPIAGNMLYIEDLGSSTDDDGDSKWNSKYRANATVFTGGVQGPDETPVKRITKTYSSTSSATYKGTGVKRTDTTDVIQGYNSYNGNGQGLWIFPSMTADLAGATINKIEVYAYANHWYNNAGGTALLKVHGYSSAPASSPTQTTVGAVSGWKKPQGRWVTLSSSFHAGFKAGTYKGFGMGPGTTTTPLYYGRFTGGTAARIRVTYTK